MSSTLLANPRTDKYPTYDSAYDPYAYPIAQSHPDQPEQVPEQEQLDQRYPYYEPPRKARDAVRQARASRPY